MKLVSKLLLYLSLFYLFDSTFALFVITAMNVYNEQSNENMTNFFFSSSLFLFGYYTTLLNYFIIQLYRFVTHYDEVKQRLANSIDNLNELLTKYNKYKTDGNDTNDMDKKFFSDHEEIFDMFTRYRDIMTTFINDKFMQIMNVYTRLTDGINYYQEKYQINQIATMISEFLQNAMLLIVNKIQETEIVKEYKDKFSRDLEYMNKMELNNTQFTPLSSPLQPTTQPQIHKQPPFPLLFPQQNFDMFFKSMSDGEGNVGNAITEFEELKKMMNQMEGMNNIIKQNMMDESIKNDVSSDSSNSGNSSNNEKKNKKKKNKNKKNA